MLGWKGLRERKGDLCQGITCIQHIIEMLVVSTLLMIKNAISTNQYWLCSMFKADFFSYRSDMYISMLKGSIINIKP